jgi:hypothetical protein
LKAFCIRTAQYASAAAILSQDLSVLSVK